MRSVRIPSQVLAVPLTLIGIMTSVSAHATGKYNIGFNEDFAAGYSQYLNGTCTGCPGNSFSASYSDIANLIYDLIQNQHVGAFREIIPIALLEPSSGQFPNNTNIMDVLAIYSAYNLNLTLSFGVAVLPSWMSVNGNTVDIMPDDNASFTTLETSIAGAEAYLLNAMWNNPNISRSWMSTRLYVEGANEFDAIEDISGTTAYSTPARAASLTQVIQNDLNHYGVSTQQTSPSIVGNYSGYKGTVADPRTQYIADYYAAGGQGFPNFHVYAPTMSPNTTYQEIVNAVSGEMTNLNNYLPTTFKGKIFLTETGNAATESPYCPAPNGTSYGPSISPSQRAYEYSGIASDPGVNANVVMLNFWRLMRLPPSQEEQLPACEGTYGVAPYDSSDGSYYDEVGLNLFSYLQSN